jgi:peptidoglycan/LPS O-acetylase OafA/YrhL
MAGASYPIWLAALAQLAFVPFAFSRVEAYPLNGVQWSLFFELFINAVHAAAKRWLTTPRLAWIVALSGTWLVATDFQFGSLSVGYNPANFAGGFARVTFSFAAGLLIYRLSRSNRLGKLGIPYLAVAVLLTLALALPAAPWCRDGIFAVAIFPAILIMALGSRPPTRLTGFVVWAGAISYPLYAIHAPLLHLAATFAPRHADGLVRATYWPFIVVTILGAATAAERYYDRPLRRRLQGRKAIAASHSALSVAPPT